jgi:cell division protein FtsW
MHKKVTADKPLLITIIILLVFGLVMIYDATAIYSKDTFGGAYRFVLLQFIWMIFGFLGLLAFYKLDYHKIGKVAYALFGVTIIVLFVLAVIGMLPCDLNIIFTPCINGANRWVFLNPSPLPKFPLLGVLGFQPSELAKFALILYLSVQRQNVSLPSQVLSHPDLHILKFVP